jgi:hypothetical protein
MDAFNKLILMDESARSRMSSLEQHTEFLNKNKYLSDASFRVIKDELNKIAFTEVTEPIKPQTVPFCKDGKIITTALSEYDGKVLTYLEKALALRETYLLTLNSSPESVDLSEFNTAIEKLEEKKNNAIELNKIVKAVDSFHAWSEADAKVKELKIKYAKLLAKVDTGVNGLLIKPVEAEGKLDLFLTYNGAYDTEYFCNPDKEQRKLSSYSGTQKPMICLLIQNYLLSKKTKALRYMFIDNIPMDKKTIELLKATCEKLNLKVFLNITGDFDQESLSNGEVLIENGELIF